MRTLITGGTVVTASETVRADVLVIDDRVAAVGAGSAGLGPADRMIAADGRYVIPGGVDVHTHMGLATPAGVSCDDFASGTEAAAWGGTTTIVDYAGHDYGEPLGAGLARWMARAEGRSHVDYGFHMMLREVDNRVLREMAGLVADGVTSFKLFMAYPGVYMVDDRALFRAMCRSAEVGALIALHAENGGPIEALVERLVAAGRTAPVEHARSRPPSLEGEATARAVALAELAGVPVHIAHLSSADALAAVRAGRDRGAVVHAETCPQYLYLSEDDLRSPGVEGAKYVCSPPLRPADHQAALWRGLRLGDLEVVATDHCPFTVAQKAADADCFPRIPNGLPGVEERVTLVHEGVVRGELGLNRWVDVVATTPARLFGLYPRKGTIAPGSDADLVVFDPSCERTLTAASHHSAVDYSCYEGRRVHGLPEVVMQRGRVLVEGGRFHGSPGDGRYLPRTPGATSPAGAVAGREG
ncbi:MAG TPA: dihydropyrimidinase [Actinomycetes bacterium]